MLRLKTPSVGKLFNYLRYCGGADARKFDEARKHREKEAKRTRGGKGWKRDSGPSRETVVGTLVAKPILIYVASELEFVNFHESRVSLKKFNCGKCDWLNRGDGSMEIEKEDLFVDSRFRSSGNPSFAAKKTTSRNVSSLNRRRAAVWTSGTLEKRIKFRGRKKSANKAVLYFRAVLNAIFLFSTALHFILHSLCTSWLVQIEVLSDAQPHQHYCNFLCRCLLPGWYKTSFSFCTKECML